MTKCAPPRPYAALTRADFDAVVDFVATGGYALKSYDRYARLRKTRRTANSASPIPAWRRPIA